MRHVDRFETGGPMNHVSGSASILFVHGAAHGGWCWEEHFTGWFQAHGHNVAAPDLPHPGSSRAAGSASRR
jgi:hypothetical protein